jgi:AraC-like DNA-binding protein
MTLPAILTFPISYEDRFLKNALEIIESNISNEQFSVTAFASEIGMSRKTLLRKFKLLTHQSVNEFIRNYRLYRAAQLIELRTATISEIAYQVGFTNLSYFSRRFKKFHGLLPIEYKNKTKPLEFFHLLPFQSDVSR